MRSSCALVLAWCLVAGCDKDTAFDAKSADDAGADGPRYVVASMIDSPEDRFTYFSVTKSLDADTSLNLRDSLEVVGHATLYGSDKLGWFAVGGAETPSITRFDLTKDDKLVKGDTLSLENYGIAWMGFNAAFVDKHKAYYLDQSAIYQLITWDPTEMKITGTIELPSLVPGADEVLGNLGMTLRGDQLLIFAGFATEDTVRPSSTFVIVDTETDSVSSSTVVDDCAVATQFVRMANGDIYIASGADAALYHRGATSGSAACLLRLPASSDELDAKRYHLEDWTGSRVSAGLFPGPDGSLIMQAYDETVEPLTDPTEAYGTAAWRLWRWTPGQDDAALIQGEPRTLQDGWAMIVDGAAYVTGCNDDGCRLLETTAEGVPPRLESAGWVSNIVRVR